MDWIDRFDLFLFDFDGLLVDTEPLHYGAYVRMLRQQGLTFDWGVARFCQVAHASATAFRDALYAHFPDLDPDWSKLYAEKTACYLQEIHESPVFLMPGVEELLAQLGSKRRCVVTNSYRQLIEPIRARIPILQTIPHWIAREDYHNPKPDPDGYLLAIERYGEEGDRIVGFEDSARGLRALAQTPACPVFIHAAPPPIPAVHARSLSLLRSNSFSL